MIDSTCAYNGCKPDLHMRILRLNFTSLACIDMVSESRHELMDKIMSEIVHHITKLLIVKSETLVI